MHLVLALALAHGAVASTCGNVQVAAGHRRSLQASPDGLTIPPWDLELDCRGSTCVDASADLRPRMKNNSRWTQWAVPEGVPPAGGWPVFIDFLVYQWQEGDFTLRPEDGHCGNGYMGPPQKGGRQGWGPPPPPPPNPECKRFLMAQCSEEDFLTKGLDGEATCKACVQELREGALKDTFEASGCGSDTPAPDDGRDSRRRHHKTPVEEYCDILPRTKPMGFEPFGTPKQSMASCFDDDGNWNKEEGRRGETIHCTSFYQWAGQLWNSRLHQYLVANGIAVVLLNPFEADTWEWYPPELATDRKKGMAGMDQPFLAQLVSKFQDGTYGGLGKGVFNPMKLIPSGYSAGAQMASWMIELQARGNLPAGSAVAAAVFLAGGSHMCYQEPPFALSQCKACTTSGGAGFRRLAANISKETLSRRQLQFGKRGGCSTKIAEDGDAPSCEFCCPTLVTELYYTEHPEEYKTHPPCFLAQTEPTSSDFNADLCASKNYYDTLQAHDVESEIVYLSDDHKQQYCVGNTDNLAAQGSPYVGKGTELPKEGMMGPPCIDHVSAFADMVEPLTKFLLCVLRGEDHCGKKAPAEGGKVCVANMQTLCGTAQTASKGDCFVCLSHGQHREELRKAGCKEADFDSFC